MNQKDHEVVYLPGTFLQHSGEDHSEDHGSEEGGGQLEEAQHVGAAGHDEDVHIVEISTQLA